MALIESTMKAIGSPMPEFVLATTAGETYSSKDQTSAHGVLIAFISNHCPYVIHIEKELAHVMNTAADRGLAAVAIHANDVARYPQDGPALAEQRRHDIGYTIPFLTDTSQDVARAFDAVCTPDFFLYDANKALYYRGQFDAARPGDGRPVTGGDLSAAIDALLAGSPAPDLQKPSIGCSIKWRH